MPQLLNVTNRLVKLLDGPNGKVEFTKEIGPGIKPPIPQHVITKARKVFEDINDKILKQWFSKFEKQEELIEKLPQYLQRFFNFEKDLIKGVKSKLKPSLREYDLKTLDIRKRLLNKISECSYKPSNLIDLRNQLVCVCDSMETTHRNMCLRSVLDVIKEAAEISIEDNPKEGEILQITDYDEILGREEELFHRHITGRSIQPLPSEKNNSDNGLFVNYAGLRRWNSFTPELSFSVGGGYFVFLSNNKGKVLTGIAVDPGFDFIRNFFRQGFTLTDIDIVLLTHGHPDHIRDFPAIVELLYERRRLPEKEKMDHKIYSVMSLGCYNRLRDYIARDPFKLLFYDTIIVDIDEDNREEGKISFSYRKSKPVNLIPPDADPPNDNQHINLRVDYFKSFHDDHSESDSYGYILSFKNVDKEVSIGFTGDSKWFPRYAEKFKDCDLICSHIVSIVETNKNGKYLKDYKMVGQAERLIRTKNHPYLFGEILFLQDWMEIVNKKSLILISEFGEEMKGKIRPDLIKRFNQINSTKIGCWSNFACGATNSEKPDCDLMEECQETERNLLTIPVDVGLRISIPLKKQDNNHFSQKVYCCICERFVKPQKIDYEIYGHEEAIFYICKTCLRSKSIDVRHAIYQKYNESGRKLKKDEAYN